MIIFISAFEEMVMYITVYCLIFPTLIYFEIEKVTKTTLNFCQILNLKWLRNSVRVKKKKKWILFCPL